MAPTQAAKRAGKASSAPKHTKASVPHEEPHSEILKLLLRDNPHITSGHRGHTENDYWACFWSIFSIHNDTINIWTHLLSAFYTMYVLYLTHRHGSIADQAPYWDKFVITLFLCCTTVCFFFSAAYHAFRSHSSHAYKKFLILDVASIGIQLFSCNVAIMYFEMVCFPELRVRYHVTLVLLMIIIVVSVPWMIRNGRTSLRTFSFIVLACSGLVAHFHHAWTRQWTWNPIEQNVLRNLLLTYFFTGFGLVVRRIQIPESLGWFRGRFHIYFSSHQIFHILVSMSSLSMHAAYGPFLQRAYTCPV
eukprot:TRINITY_DN11518_c0_g1_i1.p1 TRINITY_DN11518_c0_g1~~TRINITY_DN11518_c0_g1_i1.p1  ORF type:complete len:304 (+),score=71.25 TRINITY_DN11518_c0_g1_i1:27-938(+)